MTQEAGFDYIVVGGGSAGCIVAARLAAAGRVLLLEAGDPAEAHPETARDDGFGAAFANDALMWHRLTAPQADCGGRRLYAGSGRGMGGSGAVNGMVYTRPDRADFAAWPAGWQWDEMAPAFDAVEAALAPRPRAPTAFAERCLAAAVDAGFVRKDGLLDGDLRGQVGCNAMNAGDGRRRNSYHGFLASEAAAGVEVATGATAERIVLGDDGRAAAVVYRQGGRTQTARAAREIVLCAGALATPLLLMRSGIGPAAQLREQGITPRLDSPGVGENLQDHPNVCLFYRSRAPVDFRHAQLYAFDRVGQAVPGPDSCFVFYAAPGSLRESMLRMLPILALPGFLYRLSPLRAALRGLVRLAFALPPLRRYISRLFGIVVILGKPQSRGRIRLAADGAEIDPAFYSDARDRDTMLAALARAHEIAAQPPFSEAGIRPLGAGARPGPAEKLWRWVCRATMTTFHYCGSCRMGSDAGSPVDTALRVRGVPGLRVADASVMPDIPVCAINAISMAIGYRAADFILDEVSA